MKRAKLFIMLVFCIIVTMLIHVVTCRAGWIHIGSEVASGPWSGNGGDDYYEWWFLVTDIDTSADSSGASASAWCRASIYAYPYSFGGTVSRSGSPWCTSWGRSLYVWNGSLPSDDLIIDWSVSGSGYVEASGFVYDLYMHDNDTGNSNAFAYGLIQGYKDQYGQAWADGSVTRYSDGSAYIGLYGHATEDTNDVHNGEPNWYHAEMSYSVSGSEDNVHLKNLTQFEARAEVKSSASCNASVTVTPEYYYGETYAYAYSNTDGDSSVSVRW